MPAPTINTLPAAPSRIDPDTFSTKSDALLAALPTFVSDINGFGDYLDDNTFTAFDFVNDIDVNGVTIGRGAGNSDENTMIGRDALSANTTGIQNTASGRFALSGNTTGGLNTATGRSALFSNTTGSSNTAFGRFALTGNTTGSDNTASGRDTLLSNTTGVKNTAIGRNALYSTTTGIQNTASGWNALFSNTTGNSNTAIGLSALTSITTGSGNVGIGPINSAGTYAPVFNPTTQDNRFCMGSTSVTNAYIQVAWTVVSDARDKTDIAPVPHGLDFVKALEPKSFRYKENREDTVGHGEARYGFLAQDILALEGESPVIVDNEDPDKLRMTDQSLIAVMVNAIKDQQKIIEALEARITSLEA